MFAAFRVHLFPALQQLLHRFPTKRLERPGGGIIGTLEGPTKTMKKVAVWFVRHLRRPFYELVDRR